MTSMSMYLRKSDMEKDVARMDVDDLAQEIRRVDGSNSLGAGALAEAIMPFLGRALAAERERATLAERAACAKIANETGTHNHWALMRSAISKAILARP